MWRGGLLEWTHFPSERKPGEGVRAVGAKPTCMLLRHRPPALGSQPVTTAKDFEHLDPKAVAVLRWLQANRVQFVLVGPVAEAIHGAKDTAGPVAIVPAPFGRNFERLSRALWSAHARLRIETETETVPLKMTEEKLMRGQRWTLQCGDHGLDIEGRPDDASRYQELLYEAGRVEIAPDLSVEVASPEDVEHYAHLERTGTAPEIRISRASRETKLA